MASLADEPPASATHPNLSGEDAPVLTIEIGATNAKSLPSHLEKSAHVIDAFKLPNPHTPLSKKVLELSAPKIVKWMTEKEPRAGPALESMVATAKMALYTQRSVRVQCYGGAHRSQAVAYSILQSLDADVVKRIKVVCLDATPLPELQPYISAN
jgi:predicted protein tyrosine phosphatase